MTDQDRLAAHDEPRDEPTAGPAAPSSTPDDGQAPRNAGDPAAAPGDPGDPETHAGEPAAGAPADPGEPAAAPRRYHPVRPAPPAGPPPRAYQPAAPAQPGGWQEATTRPAAQPWQQPGQPGRRQQGQQPVWQQPGWQQPGPAQQSGPLLPQPLGAGMPAGAQPRWGWRQSAAGVLVGFAPEALLTFAAYATGTATGGSPTEVSIGSGIVLVVSSLVFYGWQLFAAWLFSLRGTANALLALGFRRPTLAYFWTVPLVLVASYMVIIANDAVLNPPQQDIVEAFPQTAAGIVLFTLLAVVMAPLAEEAFFRGFVFRGFAESWGFLGGAAASAAVFSAAHLQLTLFVPLFALGFGLAWAYKRTGSLWTNITIHAIFNGISVLAWALS